jgi:hypothetical protein
MQSWRKESPLDVVNLVLGFGLLISPWLLNFTSDMTASRNAWICGLVIALVSIAALSAFAAWEEWVNLILGAWVLVSPWILGFQGTSAAVSIHLAVGALVALIAAVDLWSSHRAPPKLTA